MSSIVDPPSVGRPNLKRLKDPSETLQQPLAKLRRANKSGQQQPNINSLPAELMRKIFSLLFANDRMSAALVCRSWHLLTMDDSFDDICLRIGDFCPTPKDFSRPFSNFQFRSIDFSNRYTNLLREYGPKLKVLSFKDCETGNELNSLVAIDCPKLEILSFENCSPGFEKFVLCILSFPALKSLTLVKEYYYDVSNLDILKMDETMPNLEHLTLETDSSISDRVILHFIENRVNTLKSITCNLSEDENVNILLFRNILKFKDLKLSKFSNKNMIELDVDIIVKLSIKFSTLVELHLNTYFWERDVLEEICTLLPNLKSLGVHGEKLTSTTNVFKLRFLRHLTFSFYVIPEIELDIFEGALEVFQIENLRYLELQQTSIGEKNLRMILSKMPHLRFLHLKEPGLTLEKATVKCITENLIYLRTLNLKVTKISEECLPLLTTIKGLRYLRLYCCGISVSLLLKTISFLELHTLQLYGLEECFEDPSTSMFLKNIPALGGLTLSAYSLEDFGDYGNMLLRKNPSLKTIFLTKC